MGERGWTEVAFAIPQAASGLTDAAITMQEETASASIADLLMQHV